MPPKLVLVWNVEMKYLTKFFTHLIKRYFQVVTSNPNFVVWESFRFSPVNPLAACKWTEPPMIMDVEATIWADLWRPIFAKSSFFYSVARKISPVNNWTMTPSHANCQAEQLHKWKCRKIIVKSIKRLKQKIFEKIVSQLCNS